MTIDIISIRDCIDLEIDPNEFVFVLLLSDQKEPLFIII